MKKLNDLRAHILKSPLGILPDGLFLFVENGTTKSRRGSANNHFEMQYKANIVITDFAGEAEQVQYVILEWLNKNQVYHEEDALSFQVDILDQNSVDLAITVDLNEIYKVVKHDNNKIELITAVEPDLLATIT